MPSKPCYFVDKAAAACAAPALKIFCSILHRKRRLHRIWDITPHHLVPLSCHSSFEVSLDVEENIVSLCSNCHNKLHYGRDIEETLRILYDARSSLLAKAGIDISFPNLLRIYKKQTI